MNSHSFSTVDVGSNIAIQIQQAILQATDDLTEDRAEHMKMLLAQIQELERRGFIKRQQYSAPTSSELERRFASIAKDRQFTQGLERPKSGPWAVG